MISRVCSLFFFLFATPLLVAATTVPRYDTVGGSGTVPPKIKNQCNTGTLSCCQDVKSADSEMVTTFESIFGVVLGSVGGFVGFGCSPVTAFGAGSNSCAARSVCCTENHFDGFINIGCSPIDLSL